MDPNHNLADITTYLIEKSIIAAGSNVFYRNEDNSLTYDPRQTISQIASGKDKVVLLTQIKQANNKKGDQCC